MSVTRHVTTRIVMLQRRGGAPGAQAETLWLPQSLYLL